MPKHGHQLATASPKSSPVEVGEVGCTSALIPTFPVSRVVSMIRHKTRLPRGPYHLYIQIDKKIWVEEGAPVWEFFRANFHGMSG